MELNVLKPGVHDELTPKEAWNVSCSTLRFKKQKTECLAGDKLARMA